MLKFKHYIAVLFSLQFLAFKIKCLGGVQENRVGGAVKAILTMSKYEHIFFQLGSLSTYITR